jgi:hypothetical protein
MATPGVSSSAAAAAALADDFEVHAAQLCPPRRAYTFSTWTPVEDAMLLQFCLEEGVWTARYPEKTRTKDCVTVRYNTWLRTARPLARSVTTHIWWQHWRTSLSRCDPEELASHAHTLAGVAKLRAVLERTLAVQRAAAATDRKRTDAPRGPCWPHAFERLNDLTIYCEHCGKLVQDESAPAQE